MTFSEYITKLNFSNYEVNEILGILHVIDKLPYPLSEDCGKNMRILADRKIYGFSC